MVHCESVLVVYCEGVLVEYYSGGVGREGWSEECHTFVLVIFAINFSTISPNYVLFVLCE